MRVRGSMVVVDIASIVYGQMLQEEETVCYEF
jgi:hypothetical protein